MNIKWENLWFLPFMPAYWTAKDPWVGLVIGIVIITGSLYLLRTSSSYKKILPVIAGIVWILFGIYEFNIWKEHREYWELVLAIPIVYFFSLLGLIQIIKALRKSSITNH